MLIDKVTVILGSVFVLPNAMNLLEIITFGNASATDWPDKRKELGKPREKIEKPF